jgi:hypothetical protein
VKRIVGCSTILSSDAPPIADVSTFVYRHSLVTLGACSATEFSCPPAQLSSILPALACAHMATPSTAELKERFVVSPLNYYDFSHLYPSLQMVMRISFGASVHPIHSCGPSPVGDIGNSPNRRVCPTPIIGTSARISNVSSLRA